MTTLKVWPGGNPQNRWVFDTANTGLVPPSVVGKILRITGGTGWTPGDYLVCTEMSGNTGYFNFDFDGSGAKHGYILDRSPGSNVTGGIGTLVTDFTKQLVLLGNSHSVNNDFLLALGLFAEMRTNQGGSWGLRNYSTPGKTTTQHISGYAAGPATVYDAVKTRNLLVIWEATNDLGDGNLSAAAAYANYVTLAGLAKATGYEVWIVSAMRRNRSGDAGDIIPRTDAFNALCRDAFNVPSTDPRVFFPASGITYADKFIDVGAEPELLDPNNTTYFNADKLHLTDAGYVPVTEAINAAFTATAVADTNTDEEGEENMIPDAIYDRACGTNWEIDGDVVAGDKVRLTASRTDGEIEYWVTGATLHADTGVRLPEAGRVVTIPAGGKLQYRSLSGTPTLMVEVENA